MFRRFKLLLLIILPLVFLSACSFRFPWEKEKMAHKDNGKQEVEAEFKLSTKDLKFSWTNNLRKFKNREAVIEFLAENNIDRGIITGDLQAEANFGLGQNLSLPDQADWQIAQVNNLSQPEIVKMDDNYAYVLAKNNLQIIDLQASLEDQEVIVSSLEFATRPNNILLTSKYLLVSRMASENDFNLDVLSSELQDLDKLNPLTNYMVIDFFNITNPRNVNKERTILFDGNILELRTDGTYLYAVSIKPASLIDNQLSVMQVLQNGNNLNTQECDESIETNCLQTEFYYFDSPYKSYNFLSLLSLKIDEARGAISINTYLVDANYRYSLSESGNFYLLRTDLLSLNDLEQEYKRELIFPDLDAANKNRIEDLKNNLDKAWRSGALQTKVAGIVDAYLQSLDVEKKAELENTVTENLENRIKAKAKEIDKTSIYKFKFNAGKINYLAKQDVAGQLIKQGSVQEVGNSLYLSSQRGPLWSQLFSNKEKIYNNIYVLDANLQVLGKLENIVTDKPVAQVFYLQDKSYFELEGDNNSMHVIDLAQKNKPTLLGGVKIPSYNYLHSFDNSGLKFFAPSLVKLKLDDEEIVENKIDSALRITLYDLSNLQSPRELGVYDIVGDIKNSLALDDHLSLYYSAKDKRLVIPMAIRAGELEPGFSGVVVLGIEDNSLKVMGQIDHSDGGRSSVSDFWHDYYYTDDMVKRSLVKDELIYTVSNKYFKINNYSNLEVLRNVKLLIDGDYPEEINNFISEISADDTDYGLDAETFISEPIEPEEETDSTRLNDSELEDFESPDLTDLENNNDSFDSTIDDLATEESLTVDSITEEPLAVEE